MNRLECERANPRQCKDRLHNDRAAEHCREEIAQHRHYGKHCIWQRVEEEHAHLGQSAQTRRLCIEGGKRLAQLTVEELRGHGERHKRERE